MEGAPTQWRPRQANANHGIFASHPDNSILRPTERKAGNTGVPMNRTPSHAAKSSNYNVKRIEPVVVGSDVQARIFTLAPGETIPWHFHKQCTDHYFVLEGALTVITREPEEKMRILRIGDTYKITPENEHLIANRSAADCRFLLVQGVGAYDWVKASD
jgi:quercetin dioxygenase-like cupin family protein